jgi:SAM-dependent methyltransferase
MDYDPVKSRMARLFLRRPWMQRLMFLLARQVFLREREVRRALRRLAAAGWAPRRALDAGTGYGQYALALRACFPAARVLSVDINPACVARLDELCRSGGVAAVETRVADLLELELDEPVDLVLNVDVVEHIEDDRRVFRNLAAALAPGGLLLLHTPAVAEGTPEAAVSGPGVRRGACAVGEHAREGYTRAMLRERLRQAGLEEVWLRATYGRAGGWAWRLGVRGPMRALALGAWTLPLVLLWLAAMILPVRLLNEIDLRGEREQGGCLLLLARRPAGMAA